MNINLLPSPNFDSRDGQPIDMLVLHYTGMANAQAALDRLRDPAAKVSAHYVVDEDGRIYNLVDEKNRAWHAGVSYWRGNTNINQRSIGIEIVNPGHELGYRPFPKAQMEAVAMLCHDIVERHGIPSWNIVAHSDVAPERKNDPGELFDWQYLASRGIGAMPPRKPLVTALLETPMKWVTRLFGPPQAAEPIPVMQAKLAAYGYALNITGVIDGPTRAAVTAFQRHFRSSCVDGVWDAECAGALDGLLARAPAVIVDAPDSRMTAR